MRLQIKTALAGVVVCSFLSLSAVSAHAYNVRGTFNGWGESPLISNGDGTYSVTISGGTAGVDIEWKVAQNDWANSWPANNLKSVYNSSGEFTFRFAPGPFSDDWMPAANRLGYDDPEQFGWEIIGSFNDWADGPQLVAQGNGLYALTHAIPEPGNHQFKFRKSGSWDISIGEDFGNGGANAAFTTTESNQMLQFELDLPKGAWRVSGAQIEQPIKAAVHFEANMGVQTSAGHFNSAEHQVWVRGNAMGWGEPPGGLQLFEDASRPGLYTNTFKMESHLPSSNFEFKFTVWNPTSIETRWEDLSNRTIAFTGTEPTDAEGYHQKTFTAYFNDQTPGDLLSEDTLVTFRVNMNGAVDKDGYPFHPGDELYINGNFANWWAWNGMPPEYQVFDDGLNGGDATADDLIYTFQRLFPRGSSTRLVYKYGIFSIDNEAPAFTDRIRYIRAVGNYVLPLDTFGDMTQEPDFGSLAVGHSAGNIVINWLGRPGVRLQRATSLSSPVWQDVPDTDGASSIEISAPVAGSEFFRLLKP